MQSIEQESVKVSPDGKVSRKDAAKIFNRSPRTLADWKVRGWGPAAIIVGGRVFHDFNECLEMARGVKPVAPELA